MRPPFLLEGAFGTGFSPWCTIVHTMDFAWDPAKAASNLLKHGVRFADAVSALEDDFALTMRDPFAEDEERWVTLGMDAGGNLLVVIYTWRGRTSRIISARPATPRERRQYYEEKR